MCFLDETGEKAAADGVASESVPPISTATNESMVVDGGTDGGTAVVTSEGGGAVVSVVTDGNTAVHGVGSGAVDGRTTLEEVTEADGTPEDTATADGTLGAVEILEGVTTDGMELLVGVATDAMEGLQSVATEGMEVMESMADGKEGGVSMPVEEMETTPTVGVGDEQPEDQSCVAEAAKEQGQTIEQPLQASEHGPHSGFEVYSLHLTRPCRIVE